MTEPDYIGPFVGLRKLLFGNTVRLRFVMLQTEDEEISLDVRRDRGVAGAISWLREIGWDIDSAIEEGTETPLVRVSAMKLQGY